MVRREFVWGHLTILCILALVVGTASALIQTVSATDQGTDPDSGQLHPHQMDTLQHREIITRLEERGVHDARVDASLKSGETQIASPWIGNHTQAGEGELPSGPSPSPPLTGPAAARQMGRNRSTG